MPIHCKTSGCSNEGSYDDLYICLKCVVNQHGYNKCVAYDVDRFAICRDCAFEYHNLLGHGIPDDLHVFEQQMMNKLMPCREQEVKELGDYDSDDDYENVSKKRVNSEIQEARRQRNDVEIDTDLNDYHVVKEDEAKEAVRKAKKENGKKTIFSHFMKVIFG